MMIFTNKGAVSVNLSVARKKKAMDLATKVELLGLM